MKLLPRIEVTAGVIWQDGKVLIAQRAEAKYAGLWEFPGGKIEAGESPQVCLARELMEELKIDCEIDSLICTTEWHREDKIIVLHTFNIFHFSGVPSLSVHSQIEWLPVGELVKESFLPADRPVIDCLI